MYKQDYEKSRQKEFKFQKRLENKYKLLTEVTDENEYFPYWDISSTATTKNNRVITFEVKYNSKYKEEKVFIELCRFEGETKIECGLSKTIADYYILTFQDDENFYCIKTDELRKLCKEYSPYKELIYDKNNFQLAMFDKKWLLAKTKIV